MELLWRCCGDAVVGMGDAGGNVSGCSKTGSTGHAYALAFGYDTRRANELYIDQGWRLNSVSSQKLFASVYRRI